MNNTSFLQSQSSSNENIILSVPYVSLFLITLYVFVIVKLFNKHRHNLEPIHIYELSILSDFVVIFSTVVLQKIEWKFRSWAPYCVLVNFVRIAVRLSVNADLSASQVDRFYIRWYNNTISGIPGGQVPVPLLERRVQREGHHQASRRPLAISFRLRIS